MAFQEYPHNFGAITAAVATQFSIDQTFNGNPNVPYKAQIKYAIIRNSTGGAVTVQGSTGSSVVGIGERKRIEFPYGCRFFLVIPAANVTSGDLTADVGIEGVTF